MDSRNMCPRILAVSVILSIFGATYGLQDTTYMKRDFKDIQLPLHTESSYVVDASGKRVKFACVNWYGPHLEDLVVNGLDQQPMKNITNKIHDLGFNCVRLTFALDMYYKNPVIRAARLAANPELIGLTAMEVFDTAVNALTDSGVMVILNNHMSSAGWCCSDSDKEGLWYTEEYPEEMWLYALAGLTARYLYNSAVVGFDLRNELRSANGVHSTWGNGNPQTDWAMAATKAGNLILENNPSMLIIVEGVMYGANLVSAHRFPIILNVPQRVVYSAHIYPFSPIIPVENYNLFASVMDRLTGDITEPGHNYTAPLWIGEVGTGDNSIGWQNIVRYLKERDFGWGYWSLDGYKYPGIEEEFGILNSDYETIRHEWKIQQLKEIQMPKNP